MISGGTIRTTFWRNLLWQSYLIGRTEDTHIFYKQTDTFTKTHINTYTHTHTHSDTQTLPTDRHKDKSTHTQTLPTYKHTDKPTETHIDRYKDT